VVIPALVKPRPVWGQGFQKSADLFSLRYRVIGEVKQVCFYQWPPGASAKASSYCSVIPIPAEPQVKARSVVNRCWGHTLVLRVNLLRYSYWWLKSTRAVYFAHRGEPRP
jgi:hypothetical protein